MAKRKNTAPQELGSTEVTAPVENPVAPTATSKAARQKRWEAWLVNARAQRPDPTIFDAQQANGEFDVIPDWFE